MRARRIVAATLACGALALTSVLRVPDVEAATVPASACAHASELASVGLPQRAVSLLESAGADAVAQCSAAWAHASQRIAEAALLAAQAQTAQAEGSSEEAARVAAAALVLDRENATAAQVVTAAGGSASERTWPERAADQLQTFTTEWLEPLRSLVTPLIGVLAALLLMARVVPLLIRDWPALPGASARGSVLATGLLAAVWSSSLLTVGMSDALASPGSAWVWVGLVVVAGSILLGGWLWQARITARPPVAGPDGSLPWYDGVRLITLGAALALAIGLSVLAQLLADAGLRMSLLGIGLLGSTAAVGLLGWWLATRLRVAVTVRTDAGEDALAGGFISSLLGDLGAAPPRGLEVPTGADASELSNALAAIPGAGTLAAKLGAFLAGLLGATPWRAEVSMVPGDALAVRLSRSGHSVGAVVIRPSDGRNPTGQGEPTPPVDLMRLAAAYVLTTLSEHHGPFPGLAGATSWRSLGLHYIATTDLAAESSRALERQVVGRAVGLDPDNRLAQLAWQHAQLRRSTRPDELEAYQRWLGAFVQDEENAGPELLSVRLRAAYSRAAVTLNRSFVDPAGPDHYDEARTELDALVATALGGGPWLDTLARQIATARDCLPPTARPFGPPPERTGPPPAYTAPPGTYETPTGLYNLAAWWGSCTESPTYPREWCDQQAVRLLSRLANLPTAAAVMSRDPQLARLRGTEVYRQAFGDDPRDDFFALAPVAPHALLLRSIGYAGPALITAEPQSLDALPAAAGAHVLGLARMHHSLVRRPPLAARAVEILHELSARGLTTPDSLRGTVGAERAQVCESAVASVTERCKPRYEVGDGAQGTLTRDALMQWWNETYPAASPPPPAG